MISKLYRLNEKELRKVLSKKKPFFSYTLIANTFPNALDHGRCAILLSGKQAKWSVNRNHFRRYFYNISRQYIGEHSFDVVFVPKKWTIYNYKDPGKKEEFARDIHFLWKQITNKKNP